MKKMVAKKIPSTRYGTIIEVNSPIRFYWDKDGNFDGVECSVPKGTSRYQKRLIADTLGLVQLLVDMFYDLDRELAEPTPIPDYVNKAFGEDDDHQPA
jgi:hypothetical protein